MSVQILPATTAGINPEKFSDDIFLRRNRVALIAFLTILTLVGFGLRVSNLSAESLSEDELNKLQTVADYRADGLSGRNGEHPFLMKGLQTASFIFADKWNASAAADRRISDEFALRFPTALCGTLTILLLFLLVKELFGSTVGLISAALWAIEPTAVGFDRIAKEDSFLLFFFLLTNFFWLRGQSEAERGNAKWFKYVLLAAIAFAALMASKYLPHLLAVSAAYYIIFQAIPSTRWRLGRPRWLLFLVVAGISFLIFNPTIFFAETWRAMLKFSSENRIAHDSYEFMGALYRNRLTAWLSGVPWTFYYVFILVKTSLVTLIFFLVGLPLLFRRKWGDGRYFLFFWAFMWFLPFTVLGGKFTRYFTVAEPLILIAAAVGFYFATQRLTHKFFQHSTTNKAIFQMILFVAFLAAPLYNSLLVTPNFRLFTNTLGGGAAWAGYYFPHDAFYDTDTREIVAEIAARARPHATVANETPTLYEYYAKKIGREDLKFVSLSDDAETGNLTAGDFIVAARGRRYFSNSRYLDYLENSAAPIVETKAGAVISARIYQLNETSAEKIRELSKP
ncbi:MAG: glycosyltransferase family 39 protein [Pyrinomonadaceae bacterium]